MKKYYLFGGIGGATVISIAVAYILMATNPTVPQTDDTLLDNMSEVLNFTYSDANTKLKEALATEVSQCRPLSG